jgi:hypothetical protein
MVIVQEKSPKQELLPANCYLLITFILKWVGSGIRVPEKHPGSGSRILDLAGKTAPDPGSGSATLLCGKKTSTFS